MNLSKKDINILVKIGKIFKIEFLYITGNKVINTFSNNILNYADIPFIFTTCFYRFTDIVMLYDIMNKDSVVTVDEYGNIYMNNTILVYNLIQMFNNNNIVNNIFMIEQSLPHTIIDDMRSNELFEYAISGYDNRLIHLKDRYIISIHKGLLSINKSDKVSMNIYYSDNNTFICKFIIDKKSFKINTIIKYIYLQ